MESKLHRLGKKKYKKTHNRIKSRRGKDLDQKLICYSRYHKVDQPKIQEKEFILIQLKLYL